MATEISWRTSIRAPVTSPAKPVRDGYQIPSVIAARTARALWRHQNSKRAWPHDSRYEKAVVIPSDLSKGLREEMWGVPAGRAWPALGMDRFHPSRGPRRCNPSPRWGGKIPL